MSSWYGPRGFLDSVQRNGSTIQRMLAGHDEGYPIVFQAAGAHDRASDTRYTQLLHTARLPMPHMRKTLPILMALADVLLFIASRRDRDNTPGSSMCSGPAMASSFDTGSSKTYQRSSFCQELRSDPLPHANSSAPDCWHRVEVSDKMKNYMRENICAESQREAYGASVFRTSATCPDPQGARRETDGYLTCCAAPCGETDGDRLGG